MKRRSRHVIRTAEDPRRRWLIVVIGLIATLVGAVLLYQYAQSQVECDLSTSHALMRQQRDLQEEMRSLREENRELAEEVVRSQRGSQIDGAATAEMQETLKSQQAEIAEMKEQLAFFRGIVEPAESAAGLRIQRLVVWPGKEDRVFHFSLVLIQSVRNESKVSGRVKMTAQGVSSGNARTIDLASHMLKPRPSLGFKFRYFQEINGAFRLPKGFDPGKVDIQVTRSDEDSLKVKESYGWQQVLRVSGV